MLPKPDCVMSVLKGRVGYSRNHWDDELRPLHVYMRFLGLPVFSLPNKSGIGWRTWFLLFYVHFYVFNSIGYVVNEKTNRWLRSLDMIRCVSACLPLNIYIWKRKKFASLEAILREELNQRSSEQNCTSFLSQLLVPFSVFFLLLVTCLQTNFSCLWGLESYMAGYLYGLPIEILGEKGSTVLCFFEWTFFFMFNWGTSLAFQLYFFVTCKVISRLIQNIKEDFVDIPRHPKELRYLSRRLQLISNALRNIEGTMGVAVLCWYIETVLAILVTISSAVTEASTDEREMIMQKVFYATTITYIIYCFVLISFGGAKVYDESDDCRMELAGVFNRALMSGAVHLRDELLLFSGQMSTSQLYLTGCKFFIITRGFMVSISAAIVTYCAVLVQLQSGSINSTTQLPTVSSS